MAHRVSVTVLLASLCLASACMKLPQNDATEPEAVEAFGFSVATNRELIAVGAQSRDGSGESKGSVYLFERQNGAWVAIAELQANEAIDRDMFNFSIAASDDTIVVGAQFDEHGGEERGSAYVFERRDGALREVARLRAGDGAAGDEFGLTVSVSGETIAVGARLADNIGPDSGSVYVFERRAGRWTEAAKLMASDAAPSDLFGRPAISGDTIVVGTDFDDDKGENSGSAYVFVRRDGVWQEVAKLTASDGAAGDELGISAAISGNALVVGALGHDGAGKGSGAAYVYERHDETWREVAKLLARDSASADGLGLSVAVDDDTIVVGALAHEDRAFDAGSAFVFERQNGTWREVAKLTASDGAVLEHFGVSVAVSGNTIVVGTEPWDENGEHSDVGAAYVFERVAGGWVETAKLTPTRR